MKKINTSSVIFWILGDIFVALGVSVCSKTDLGVSMIAAPAFVISDATASVCSWLNVGNVEYLFQLVLLIVLCLILREFKPRYLLAFAVAVVYGFTLNFFQWALGTSLYGGLWLRWVMLLVGDTITALGVACFFKTTLPLQVYELFVAESARRFEKNINLVKWIFDGSLLVVSIALGVILFVKDGFDFQTFATSCFHHLGLGTIVTTLINSPIIAFHSKNIDRIKRYGERKAKTEK